MKSHKIFSFILATMVLSVNCFGQDGTILLRKNWAIKSSKEVKADGKTISTTAFQPEKWYPATVPSTVFGTLVENKVYPDPYYGTNFLSLPGYNKDKRDII